MDETPAGSLPGRSVACALAVAVLVGGGSGWATVGVGGGKPGATIGDGLVAGSGGVGFDSTTTGGLVLVDV